MSARLRLTIATPLEIVVRDEAVASLRAEDASGDFGIQPGHADFLTVIDAGVMRWRGESGPWLYCALRGGVLSVIGGDRIHVACREAILSEDLASLRIRVAAVRAENLDAARRVRSRDTQLHLRAIRRLTRELAVGGDTLGLGPEADP